MANYKSDKNSKVANYWNICSNPLRDLTQTGIKYMLDCVRRGNDVKLQVAQYEMERNAPIFGICINKRLAGIMNRNWDIVPFDESSEAKAQADVIKKIFKKAD